MSQVKLSVEEFNTDFQLSGSEIHKLLGLQWILPQSGDSPSTNHVSVPCDTIEFIDPQDCGIEKDELDLYLPGHTNSTGNTINVSGRIMPNNDISNLFGKAIYNNTQVISKSKHTPLSQSVDGTMPNKPRDVLERIEIIGGFEESYKARYKSDYFAQNGKIRSPRYVADAKGNHYITVKVQPGIQDAIRVDWVSVPTETNIRYSMPCKFQISNDSLAIPDCNPLYAPIVTDPYGKMKLYLVLIKSKQDELKKIQSLEVFPPSQAVIDNTQQIFQANPKRFIQHYQLDKSQLAFTICTVDPTGQKYIPDWSTTIYSTILTERSADTTKKRKVTCPECQHSFEITMDGAADIVHKDVTRKRKKMC